MRSMSDFRHGMGVGPLACGLGLAAALAVAGPASAQTAVSWYVVAAGGGLAGDGIMSVEGTIGQPAVGLALISTDAPAYCPTALRLAPGFWHPNRTVCAADFNQNGARDVSDIFAFLSTWFAGGLQADANCSGSVLVDDIFAFLSLWFAGC